MADTPRIPAWSQVKVTNKKLERFGQAGRILWDNSQPRDDGTELVEFNPGEDPEVFAVSDLEVLAGG